jgi:hypothetical protein
MTIVPVTTNENDNWFGFGEGKGSLKEGYDFYQGTIEATRIFIGPWANRFDFIRYKLLAEVAPGEAGANNSITPPNAYPDVPAATAYKCDVEGISTFTQTESEPYQGQYKYAKLTVHYKIFPFGLPGGSTEINAAFIEENIESTAELIPIPYSFTIVDSSPGFKQAGLPAPLKGKNEGKFNKVIVIKHYKLTIPIVIEPDFYALNAMAGKVNSEYIQLPSGYIVPPETFRFDGETAVSKREISQGRLAWTITLGFGHYYPGWNTLPGPVLSDPDDPASEVTLEDIAIDPPLYASADLNLLLYGNGYTPYTP